MRVELIESVAHDDSHAYRYSHLANSSALYAKHTTANFMEFRTWSKETW